MIKTGILKKVPIVKINKIEDIENHNCMRVKDFKVCSCLFEYSCPKCGKKIFETSKTRVEFDLKSGCWECSRRNRKIQIKKISGIKNGFGCNVGEKLKNKKSLKTIGDIGELNVCLKLESLGLVPFMPRTSNVKDIDIIVGSPNSEKTKRIQVKTSNFNHNNFLSNNGTSIVSLKLEQIKFDFIIIYMINYETYWIIPKEDFLSVFKFTNFKNKTTCAFRSCWLNIDYPKAKIYPYQDRWDLIEKSLL